MNSIYYVKCATCFEIVDTSVIKCSNPYCTTFICSICFKTFIDVSCEDNLIPKCINKNCNIIYVLKNFKKESALYHQYIECCIKSILNNSEEKVEREINIDSKIELIRKERKVFIEDKFPAVIAHTANHFFKSRIMKLEKAIKEEIEEEDKKLKRKCMRITCRGYLDDNLKCNYCFSKFCDKCEKVKEKNHVCKEENVESINLIKSMIKCPKCGIAVEKSEGCNSMRCSNCQTNFEYTTGNEGGGGNSHNQSIMIKEKRHLYIEFVEYLNKKEILHRMQHLESLEPSTPKKKLLEKQIKEYIKGETSYEQKKKIALQYQRYILNKFLFTKFRKIMNECEDLIIHDKLVKDNLEKIIEGYEHSLTLLSVKKRA